MQGHWKTELEQQGFAVLAAVFDVREIRAICTEVEAALNRASAEAGPLRRREDAVVASRNVLALWPQVIELALAEPIQQALAETLGPDCGLVRVLYFDKPPGQSWALPWHKDLTIAVREHQPTTAHFSKPTLKAGVPHVEAPENILRRMLTVRVHLDDVTEENGPLLVIPGSHHDGKHVATEASPVRVQSVLVQAGDVLLMRPLLSHCSHKSADHTQRRRRIVHLEFAASEQLAEGYAWHTFQRLSARRRTA